jgi:hypothetical protein
VVFTNPVQQEPQRQLAVRQAVEIVAVLQPPHVAPVLGMQEERHAEPLCRPVHRPQAGMIKIAAVDMGADLGATK